MTSLETLAARLEQAGPESQAELLKEAYAAVFGKEAKHDEWYGYDIERMTRGRRFNAMLDCGAYLSAAGMLLAPDCLWTMDSWEGAVYSAGIWRPAGRQWLVTLSRDHQSKTAALALAAACLRAAIAGKES